MHDKPRTSSTEAERVAEQFSRNIERRVSYRSKREAYIKARIAYIKRMADNPAFMKVQAD